MGLALSVDGNQESPTTLENSLVISHSLTHTHLMTQRVRFSTFIQEKRKHMFLHRPVGK